VRVKVSAMISPNSVSEIRSIGSSTRFKGMAETSDIESSRNIGGKHGIECRGAVEPSDFLLDPVGSQ
jgi:hypothetical protein